MRKSLLTAALTLAVAITGASAANAAFPERPINLIVPFSAGGSTDLDARAFATIASKYIGQPMMVANKPGGSGVIGSNYVVKSKPDGYNIVIGRPGAQGVATACFPDTTPFTLEDYTFLGMIDATPVVLMVHPDAPYKTVKELLDYIKANPGKLKYSSSGVGSIHNMATQRLLNLAGMKHDALIHVPYKGGGEALTAIMGGQVDLMLCVYNEAASFIKAKTLRPIMVMTAEPFKFAPDVPTAVQSGMPEMQMGTWFVLLGPKGMPQDVQDKYWDTIQKVVADPDYQRMIADIGCVPFMMNAKDAKAYVVEQNRIFREIGKAIGIVKQ